MRRNRVRCTAPNRAAAVRVVMSSAVDPVASARASASASSRWSCRPRKQTERVGLSAIMRENSGPAKPQTGSCAATAASKARRSADRADSPLSREATVRARLAMNSSWWSRARSSLRGK